MKELIRMFNKLIDVRDSKGKRHCLTHILVMSVCCILNKCQDFEDIHDYAVAHEKWFDEKLKLWNGIPCKQTFINVFKVIPAETFLTIFMNWIALIVKKSTGQQIIIDGKAIRAATEKCESGKIPYIVSAYIAGLGISIGQLKVDEKSNEIKAIPDLIKLLDIEGCIITIDAIGTQKSIMDLIKKQHGDFILPAKMNQKNATTEVIEYFKDALEEDFYKAIKENKEKEAIFTYTNSSNQKFEVYIKREKSHGRTEERIYVKSTEVNWLILNDKKWKHVKAIVMNISNTDKHGNSTRYFFSSIDLPVKELGTIIRNHWQIENNLHWQLDMYFYEDLSRNRKDNSMENLSLLRKIAYNILKLDTRYDRINKNGNLVKMSTKRKMNRYVNYPDEFEELLYDFLPSKIIK